MSIPIICFGDSITHADGFAEGDRWPTVLQCLLDEQAPGAYKVYNRGVGGNTAVQGADRWAEAVAPLLPGILLIEFGYNDASVQDWTCLPRVSILQFKLKMKEFHRVALAAKSQPIFIINHTIGVWTEPQGNGKPYHVNYAPYDAAIREIIAETAAHFIDLPALMKARQTDLADFLSADKIHLTPAGNHTYAAMIHDGLQGLRVLA